MSGVQLGFEVGLGTTVTIPVRHLAVTGQTQESGKTTTLEALVDRAGRTALAFVTKRGESAFASGHRVQPYFRDRADWQFVDQLLEAQLHEKNKFLRPWIIRICRQTKTLRDVHQEVKKALATAKGISQGVYTQLDAYLDLIVPEISRANLAGWLHLKSNVLNVMDVSAFPTAMQMLFVQSAIDWVNENGENTIVIVPEAWEFIPEGKGSPVKASAVALVRKGAGIGNYIWVDSQDMAGVDKTILRGCAVWLIGVQREANEIKRNLANIPKGIKHPTPAAVAMLERGQFYACWAENAVKTYVRPAWMPADEARSRAQGVPHPTRSQPPQNPVTVVEDTVKESEARALREENERLKTRVTELQRQVEALAGDLERFVRDGGYNTIPPSVKPASESQNPEIRNSGRPARMREQSTELVGDGALTEDLYQAIRSRLAKEAPEIIQVLVERPEVRVLVTKPIVEIDSTSLRGRVMRLIAQGWFSQERSTSATRKELSRTGADPGGGGNLSTILSILVREGFLTSESAGYLIAPGVKAQVIEK